MFHFQEFLAFPLTKSLIWILNLNSLAAETGDSPAGRVTKLSVFPLRLIYTKDIFMLTLDFLFTILKRTTKIVTR